MRKGRIPIPPRRLPSIKLTPHQRRVLEKWESSNSIRLTDIAGAFSTTASAVCETLKTARAKKNLPMPSRRRKVRLVSLTMLFSV